jgi:hypothetical protein
MSVPPAEYAHRLASAVAARLARVLPDGFAIAEDVPTVLTLRSPISEYSEEFDIVQFLQAGRTRSEGTSETVYQVLSLVQDFISEELRSPWPCLHTVYNLALPGVSLEEDRLHFWYGPQENPVIDFRSISIAQLDY